MKKAMVVLPVMLWLMIATGNAQNNLPNDSNARHPKFQLAAGGYLGTHFFIPRTPGVLDHFPGYEQGIFIRAIWNMSRKFHLSADARYLQRNGVIDYNDHFSPHVFLVKATGFQIPVLFTYTIHNRKKKELLDVSAGIAYHKVHYRISHDEVTDPRIIRTTDTRLVTDESTNENFSALFAINKRFRLTRRNDLCFFNEYEWMLNELDMQQLSSTYIGRSTDADHFRPVSVRLGCYFTF